MIIISDCFKDKDDEGCIKLTSSLAKKLKARGSYLISINDNCAFADVVIPCNKILLNKKLFRKIDKKEGNILYIPFASNTLGSAIRVLILSFFSNRKVSVLFALQWKMNKLTKIILKLTKCNIISLSEDSYAIFSNELNNRCFNIHTGVDTSKFVPVDENRKTELRKKYGIPEDKVVLLHVGHLKHGRNVDAFLSLPSEYLGLLLFSSVTEKEHSLKESLLKKSNIRICEEYYSNVEEIYQLSDAYVFPVSDEKNSIDIPLSVLEAAGCNLRILTTPYKEIKYFKTVDGLAVTAYDETFWDKVPQLLKCNRVETRKIAIDYDWNLSLELLEDCVNER